MKADNRLTLAYVRSHPIDAARALEKLPPDAIARLLDTLDARTGGPMLGYMTPDVTAASLAQCARGHAAALLDAMPAAAAARAARAASPDAAEALHAWLQDADRAGNRRQLRYPLHSVGGHMESVDTALPDDLPPADVLRRVRQRGANAECEIWLVDREYRLSGVVPVTALLQAGAADALRGLMRPAPPALPARMPLTVAREQAAWHSRRRLPVTDGDGTLVGVIDYRTVLDATRAEAGPAERPDAMESLLDLARIYWIAIAAIFDTMLGSRAQQRAPGARGEHGDGR